MSRFPIRSVFLLVPLSLAARGENVTTPAAANAAPGTSTPIFAAAGSARDVAAIEAIVATFDEAWTNQDPVTCVAQYAGAEWIRPAGVIQTGAR